MNKNIRPLQNELKFDHLTVKDGLSYPQISAIVQDKRGFLWLGTFDGGLNRYDGYDFKVYRHDSDDQSSLRHDRIFSLFEDSRGDLWVGTRYGLDRFDYDTETFYHFNFKNDNPSYKLAASEVRSICEDMSGTVWAGTFGAGLNRYNRETNNFTQYLPEYPTYSDEIYEWVERQGKQDRISASILQASDNLTSQNAFEVSETSDYLIVCTGEKSGSRFSDYGWLERGGVIWELSRENSRYLGGDYKNSIQIDLVTLIPGEYRLHYISDSSHSYDNWNMYKFPDHQELWGISIYPVPRNSVAAIREKLTENSELNNSISHCRVNSICADPSGKIWIATDGAGLNLFDPETETFAHFTPDRNIHGTIRTNFLSKVLVDKTGTLWVGNYYGGLDRYDMERQKFVNYNFSRDGNCISEIYETREGVLWVGTKDGLKKYDHENNSFVAYQHDPDDDQSLSHDRIWSIYQDRFNVFWVGTYNGLDMNYPERTVFSHYHHDQDNPNSLESNGVRSIFEESSGKLWIGTSGKTGVLDLFNRKKNLFSHYYHDPGDPFSLTEGEANAVIEDRQGTIWIGTGANPNHGGINRFDQNNNRFIRYQNDSNDHSSLSNNRIFHMLEGNFGFIWIATEHGLNRFDKKSHRFIRYYPDPDNLQSRVNKSFYYLHEDQNGDLWIGTDNGLLRFNKTSETFTRYTNDQNDPNTLSNNNVNSIYEDRSGFLWIGTTKGLNRLDRKREKFTRFFVGEDLPSNFIKGITEDFWGNLWIGTGYGLSKFNPRRNFFRNYGQDDGLEISYFNVRSSIMSSTGEMFFGGDGMVSFYPTEDNRVPPDVVISGFQLFNKNVVPGKDSPLKKVISETNEIRLSYEQDVFSFDFTAIHFDSPKDNSYAYKMEGLEDDWNHVDKRNYASYSHLSPGDYKLRVKACNADGYWSDTGASIRIIILPPWWRTWWAYSIYAIILGLIGYLIRIVLNNRRMVLIEAAYNQGEMDAARELQQSQIPSGTHELGDFIVNCEYHPANEVGGDYFDFRLLKDGRLVAVIGDVTGHGLPAGILVAMTKAGLIASHQDDEVDVENVLKTINEVIYQGAMKGMFLSFCYLLFDPEKKSLICSVNGHPFPLISRRGESAVTLEHESDLPLGAFGKREFIIIETSFKPGDKILIYTDGIPEQANSAGDGWGYDNFKSEFEKLRNELSTGRVPQRIIEAAQTYADGTEQMDDMTAVTIKYR
ncbi:MAG: two-component regulator propeller domain-containing protein [Candidatus Electryonea clarkiae]|nr:two-component regulator propeller domain-containing protein [Candidatus Electryonea clarkiae]MDP8289291.1 two-component regulator propeller domain-containing protein [Candidatus Electryonea clarkiae]